ncbi:MAG: hypothetical protein GX075_11085, partial [Firmicutes bacterium]|nr:hypothetical protein [Bacillota bacterium]
TGALGAGVGSALGKTAWGAALAESSAIGFNAVSGAIAGGITGELFGEGFGKGAVYGAVGGAISYGVDTRLGGYASKNTFNKLMVNGLKGGHNGLVRGGDFVEGFAYGFAYGAANEYISRRLPLPTSGYEPEYDRQKWGKYCSSTNCYAYALDLQFDLLTEEPFPKHPHYRSYLNANYDSNSNEFGMQPGHYVLDERIEPIDYQDIKMVSEKIIRLVKMDAEKLGWEFGEIGEYQKASENAYKVALVISTGEDKGFHWYRQDRNGLWSHKQGPLAVINKDESGNLIYNPRLCDRGIYDYFVGYFYVKKPIKE